MELMNITSQMDISDLEGQDVSNAAFGDFRIVKANHAPELNAVAIMATDTDQGYLFFAFLPYSSSIWI